MEKMVREKKKQRFLAEARELRKTMKSVPVTSAEMIREDRMPGKVFLDVSVIAAISFFRDGKSERAANAIEDTDLITVDLAIAEEGIVAWKRVVHFQEDRERTFIALQKSVRFILEACEVIKITDLIEDASGFAVKHRVAFHDSLYLVAAEREKAPFLTLDKKLCDRAKDCMNIQLI